MLKLFECAIIASSLITAPNSYLCSQQTPTSSTLNEIDLSSSVLIYYYKKYLSNSDCSINYQDYVLNYRNSTLSINDFTNLLCENNKGQRISKTSDIKSSSDGGDYFLGDTINESTRWQLFSHEPVYNAIPLSFYQDGDIFMEYMLEHSYHTGIVNRSSKSISGFSHISSFVETIEAVQPEVQYGFLDDERIARNHIKIYRKEGITSSDSANIRYFLTYQLGKEYKIDPVMDTSITGAKWYCNELTWSAFNYTGINLTPNNPNVTQFILAGTWLDNSSAALVNFPTNSYLYPICKGRYQNKWVLWVYNFTSTPRTIIYNSKMCFESDAENWSNLNDIDTTPVSIYNFTTIYIQDNFFAGAVAMSYLETTYSFQERKITYGNQLTTSSIDFSRYYVLKIEE